MMIKYRIAQIVTLIATLFFLLMVCLFTLITKVHVDFKTTISDGVFESKINWITPIPKLKELSIPLAKIEEVTLTEDNIKNKNFYSLEFKLANKFNSKLSNSYHVSLMTNQYEYAKKVQENIEDALQNKKEFTCELFSLNIPEIRKGILTLYASAAIMVIIFIVLLIMEKKEKNKITQSDIKEETTPNNINDSIIK